MVAAQIHGRNRRASSSKGLRWCADAGNVAARMSSRALPEIRFRRATLADVPRVVALVERAYRGEVSRKGWTTEADLLDGQRTDPAEVEGLVSGPRSHLLLATSSDDTTTGPLPETCDDAKHNQDETDIDCGGPTCDPCGFNAICKDDIDCTSGWCDAGKCGDPGCLADSDCDMFDLPCAEAMCNVETKFCDIEAVKEGEACEDGDLCTKGELCGGGACSGGVALDCSDLTNVCGIGLCDDQTGECKANPIPDMDGLPCDDGWVCTPDDTCVDGLCGVGGPGYLWFEDFSEPDPEWVLGALWEIGPAVESQPGKNGKDPGSDHSPGADEMLAGTAIGELVDSGDQAKTCLTSPEIDASAAPAVWLSFWRHLHTDYFPFAVHTVEVWNNNDWTVVEIGYGNPGIDDPQWKQVSFDLSNFASDALKVRVCLQQTNGAKAAGGWSVDDLTIGPFVCTPDK